MSEQASPTASSAAGSPTGPPAAAATAEEPKETNPVVLLCNKMYDASRQEQWQEVLMAWEELQTVPGLQDEVERLPDITRSWGRALDAAAKIGADKEHIEEMVFDFEGTFGFSSPYLGAVMLPEMEPHLAVKALHEKFGYVNADAVDGVLDRCKNPSPDSIRATMKLLKDMDVNLPQDTLEKFQKFYIFRMKSEDPEAVYKEMLADGLKPTTTHGFNMIFARPTLSKPVMSYYEEMLDYGIKPQVPTLRILSKHPALSKEDAAMIRRRVKQEPTPEERYVHKIRLCQNDSNLEDAEKVMTRMVLEGMVPDKYVYNHIIMCCKKAPEAAEEWYQKMLAAGIEPNAVTYTNLITVWKDSRLVDNADKWITEMMSRGMQLDNHNYCALLDAYVRSGNRVKVQGLFRQLIEKGGCGITLYNTVMKLGPFDWAVGCLACILAEGLQPTTHTRSTMQNLARDAVSQDIVAEMHRCQWNKENLLRSEMLTNPPRGTTPSLLECMRFMMRELKLESHIIDLRTADYNREVAKAQGTE